MMGAEIMEQSYLALPCIYIYRPDVWDGQKEAACFLLYRCQL